MKNIKQTLCCLLWVASSFSVVAQVNVVDRVNPIIGTNGMGHTFPGACVPFGLVQLSPDTDTIPHNVDGKYQPRSYEYCAGYQHKDSSIVGFSHTHFSGTGHSDLGDLLIMPTTDCLKLNPGTATDPDGGYRSRFSHDTEISRPGYYEVMLADYGIRAQLTATKRAGVHKYTFPKQSKNQRVILDMIHGIYNYDGKVLWTSIRALHPLFNIINRQVNTDIAQSMLKHGEQSVHKALPVWSHMANENWCMIGYHSVSVLADAVTKGLPLDKEEVVKAMVSSSTIPYYDGTKEYMEKGYVPLDRSASAGSLTLEYAYDDWTIYTTALAAGNTAVADQYKKRAQNFRNVFETSIGYARPRYADGRWKENFNLLNTHGEGFIEGNALNYTFYVPQDVKGMISLMGGEKSFVSKLDSLFTMHLPDEFFAQTEDVTKEGLLGGYVHGNEPSHHIPFLYAWTGQPWKTQYWQREIMNRMYRNNIDGLCGNDDCGQMSAWYILSGMGFYPVCPGTDQYVLGAPYLPYMKVNMENGNSLIIKADKVSDKNRYVKSVKLNGKPYLKGYITQQDIMNGGELSFEMTSRPEKGRLFTGDNSPYSLSE